MINTLFQPGFPVNTMYIHLMYLEVLLLFVEGRQLPDSAVSYIHVCTANLHLKPQDSFGELDKFFLIFRKCRKSSENTITAVTWQKGLSQNCDFL